MWRFIFIGLVAVAADDRWSRQSTERRQGDWIPVAAPCLTCHQHQKGRSFDQDSAAAASGLPSVLTPPIHQHSRLLPPPPPDNLFQHSSPTGFISSYPNQPQQFNDNKPRQFLNQQNINNRPQEQSSIRFKSNSQIPDSAGIPSTLFQVSPQQFTPNTNHHNSQFLTIPQFNGAPFIPPPQRSPLQPFTGLNRPLLHQNLPFSDFHLSPNPPVFLSSQTGGLPSPPQFSENIYDSPQNLQLSSQIGQPSGRFTPNITNDFKQGTQSKGKEEVQLLYVPVETLRQNQRGRNSNNGRNRGNKKVEPSYTNNNFDSLNQPTESNNPIQTAKPIYQQQNVGSGEQFFTQNQNIAANFQNFQPQNHQVIQETNAPQIQYNQNAFPQQIFQEQTTFAQDLRNQYSSIATPPPQNNDKLKFDKNPQDDSSYTLKSEKNQFTFKFQQEPIQQTIKSTTPKLQTANQNFYQSQQFSNQDDFENSQEYTQHSLGSEEQQTTMPPPHQPPLSVYMETNPHSKIADVLTHLKNSKTIPVLDTIGPDSPQVFVGPSNLNPPSGYLKFELPYLSAIDSNRVERKVDRLPFFVAPLNFQPPPGYSKIPFPAPHIGSVVVSNATVLKAALHEKPDEYLIKPETSTENYINQYNIPSNISPLSPQLPSLINSLQDEQYFPTTTEIPTTVPVQTTPVYTTPQRRHPGRGSHRSQVTTTSTEVPITRRPVSRQRRPLNRQNSSFRNTQAVSTSTPEPVTTANTQYEEQSEIQQKVFSDLTTENSQEYNQNYRRPAFDSNSQNSAEINNHNQQQTYNEQGSFNSNQQQPNDQFNSNQQNFNNVLQSQGISEDVIPQLEQVQQYFTQIQQQQYLQGNYQQKPKHQSQQTQPEQEQIQTVQQQKQIQTSQENYQIPNHNLDSSTQKQQNHIINEEYYNNNNYSPSNGFVSDTTQSQTTEALISKVTQQTVTESTTLNSNKFNSFKRDPLRQRFRGKNQYQTTTEYARTKAEPVTQSERIKHRKHPAQNVQIVRDNSNSYQDNYPTNTERLDEQLPTERNQVLQFNNNDNYYNNDQKQFVNIQNQNYQNRQQINSNGQFYQEQYTDLQKPPQYNKNEPLFDNEQLKPVQYNKEEQSSHENDHTIRVQLENSTPFTEVKETTPVLNADVHNPQQIYTDISSKYEEQDHVTERPTNQQRQTKYTRVRGNVNPVIRQPSQLDQNNQYKSSIRQNNYESQSSPSFPTSPSTIENNQFNTESVNEGTTESEPEQIITTTPKPVVVRVRGRVRNRQRTSGIRQTTTTEPPNYPAGAVVDTNSDSQYVRKSPARRLPHVERNSNYNRHSNRFRNSNSQNTYSSKNTVNNNNENSENESSPSPSSTISSYDETTIKSLSSTTTPTDIPVSRKYNHILNRNIVRRPSGNRQLHQSTTTSTPPHSGSTEKYLVRTTRRPTTQFTKLPEGRARIRRPSKIVSSTTTTTEYPSLNQGQDNFAPSAASNEVLDPYYPQQVDYNTNHNNHHHTSNYNNHNYQTLNRNPTKQFTPSPYESSTILTPTPFSPALSSNEDDGYWNHGVTIQQSNSYDFSAESSPVTQSTLNTHYANEDEEYSHKSSPSWVNPSTYNLDQTPFSSNEQYVATQSKNKLKSSPQQSVTGKENRWNEKGAYSNEPQDQQQQQYESQSDVLNNEQHNYQTNEQRQQEYGTERTVLQTSYPTDTISEQTENNKYIATKNEGSKGSNYESSSFDEGQTYSVAPADDSSRNKDTLNSNLQGKPIDPVTGKKSGRRRGAWVRVRVNKKPKDVFETAESQNLASVSNDNTIKSENDKVESEKQFNVPPNHRPTDPYSTDIPQTTRQSLSQLTTTTEQPTTIKNDDSLKKSLTDMIREIIKEQEDEEEDEAKKINENVFNKNNSEQVTMTTTPISLEAVTEISGTTITTMVEGPAVTVVPDMITQSSSDSEGATTINSEIFTVEVNTVEPRVLGTSTTTEISLETEICYRGRCVKSKKNKKPLKSHKSSSPSLSSSDFESDLMSVE